jgi:hypothetical protein
MDDPIYLQLKPGQALPSLEVYRPFKALLVIDETIDNEWQSMVSEWLVRGGCLYMMAWGRNCSSWDDSVDLAILGAFDFREIPDDDFVMTTWHDHEPLEEAMWFAAHTACHPTVALERTVIVHICGNERGAELVRIYLQAEGDPV